MIGYHSFELTFGYSGLHWSLQRGRLFLPFFPHGAIRGQEHRPHWG